jgi:hypothetical protein
VTAKNQWFVNQARVSAPYTQSVCLQDSGVYKEKRIYLNADQDSDGLKDYKSSTPTFHIKDNMLYA